jgi:hypothetical protein
MGNLVLSSTRFLVDNPRYVFINKEKLEETAEKLSQEKLEIPSRSGPAFLEGKSKEVINFFFLACSIDFAFRDIDTKIRFEMDYHGEKQPGSLGMWACLRRALEGNYPYLLEGGFLKGITMADVEKIFEGKTKMPMLAERLSILREVGNVLHEKYDDHFYNLVNKSNHRLFDHGTGIVERLTRGFPSFDDSAVFGGNYIRFDKRAQLAPGLLYSRFRNEGDFVVEDVDELTVFADYIVPRNLRGLGVLKYEQSLADRVDNEVEIPRHSREELEIRASTIHAANMILEKINEIKGLGSVNALHIDNRLWHFHMPGQHHHLTRSTDY